MIKSTSEESYLPIDRYPNRPTREHIINKKMKDLTKTFLNLLMFGFLIAEATVKKFVRLLNANMACPKF